MANQHELYATLWSTLEVIDKLMEHLRAVSASEFVDATFHDDLAGLMANLVGMRKQVAERLTAIEEQDHILRLQRQLAEAQARIRELEGT